jgi:tetratricopeptide (TPR) repeat protein
VLDPAGIPTSILASTSALKWLTHRRSLSNRGTAGDVDPALIRSALQSLHRLNLVTTAAHIVTVHGLVQRATREPLADDQRAELARAAADALAETWPSVEHDAALAQALRANTGALRACAGEALWRSPSAVPRLKRFMIRLVSGPSRHRAHPVLFLAGSSLGDSGQVSAAASYYEDLRSLAERYLGADHPDTLSARYNEARWLASAGRLADATAAYESLLKDSLRLYGHYHALTLATCRSLADCQGEMGDAAGAAAGIDELLLGAYQRVYGRDHPETLTTRHNLAYWQGAAGDAVGAATAFESLLADRLRVLGPDDVQTLITRSNLAFWRGEAGDHVGAVAAYEELVGEFLRVLGPDHPDTLIARYNLACFRGRSGDPRAAVRDLKAVLADRLRVLGSDHPDIQLTRRNLAHWREQAGSKEAGTSRPSRHPGSSKRRPGRRRK